MRVLVACEFSGTVRDAFAKRGHDAMSCDLLPSESKHGLHYIGDVRELLEHVGRIGSKPIDLMIAHPPCTFLTISANKWMKPEWAHKYPTRVADREAAAEFFMALYNAPIPKIAVENPIGVMSTRFRKPDQVLQPWMFGHGETKATCLWLKGLPKLIPTHMKNDLFAEPEPREREQRLHYLAPSPTRWMERSKTFQGIADAMAEQWG